MCGAWPAVCGESWLSLITLSPMMWRMSAEWVCIWSAEKGGLCGRRAGAYRSVALHGEPKYIVAALFRSQTSREDLPPGGPRNMLQNGRLNNISQEHIWYASRRVSAVAFRSFLRLVSAPYFDTRWTMTGSLWQLGTRSISRQVLVISQLLIRIYYSYSAFYLIFDYDRLQHINNYSP